jgi:DNA-binding NtrC family response regulator
MKYGWPVNVRQLRNVIERLCTLGERIDAAAVEKALSYRDASTDINVGWSPGPIRRIQ